MGDTANPEREGPDVHPTQENEGANPSEERSPVAAGSDSSRSTASAGLEDGLDLSILDDYTAGVDIPDAFVPVALDSTAPSERYSGQWNPASPEVRELAEQTTYGEILLTDLISRQLALSLTVAFTFLGIIFAIPLYNYYLPALANIRVLGFTVSWLFLAVAIYPIIWGLAYYFVGTSKKYEDDFTRLVK